MVGIIIAETVVIDMIYKQSLAGKSDVGSRSPTVFNQKILRAAVITQRPEFVNHRIGFHLWDRDVDKIVDNLNGLNETDIRFTPGIEMRRCA